MNISQEDWRDEFMRFLAFLENVRDKVCHTKVGADYSNSELHTMTVYLRAVYENKHRTLDPYSPSKVSEMLQEACIPYAIQPIEDHPLSEKFRVVALPRKKLTDPCHITQQNLYNFLAAVGYKYQLQQGKGKENAYYIRYFTIISRLMDAAYGPFFELTNLDDMYTADQLNMLFMHRRIPYYITSVRVKNKDTNHISHFIREVNW